MRLMGVIAFVVMLLTFGSALGAGGLEGDGSRGGYWYILDVALLLGMGVCLWALWRVRRAVRRVERERDLTIDSLMTRHNELEATLSSMVEAVLAVDGHQRIISLNAAAARLLDVQPSEVISQNIRDVIKNDQLRAFIAGTLRVGEAVQAELDLSKNGSGKEATEKNNYVVQGAVLSDATGGRIGSLIVLHDVTRLRQLETVRRDFVSNASHEIKTPVTAIKAAAETMKESGDDPEAVDQFLPMILRQADRLSAIVEDLLTLARLEREEPGETLEVARESIAEILRVAVETCQTNADEREMTIEIECDAGIEADLNAALIEQALVNLLNNAVKYSDAGKTIRISAEKRGNWLVLAVTDEGHGIMSEHLPRIFERFYRTDKARSREMGGTGLGLAIVKHIANVHGGRVSVDSKVGEGSTFRMYVPAG